MKLSIILAIVGIILTGNAPARAQTKTKWSGLQGKLLVESREVTLPNNENKDYGGQLIWKMGVVAPAGAVNKRVGDQKGLEGQEVRLSVGPYVSISSGTGGRFNVKERKGPLQGMLLTYPTEADSTQLSLEKEVADNSVWKVHDWKFQSSKEGRPENARNAYSEYSTVEFRLEARNRAGWFLFVDDQSRIRITKDSAKKYWINVSYESFHDDLKDGK